LNEKVLVYFMLILLAGCSTDLKHRAALAHRGQYAYAANTDVKIWGKAAPGYKLLSQQAGMQKPKPVRRRVIASVHPGRGPYMISISAEIPA
jgi:hypothetical protein